MTPPSICVISVYTFYPIVHAVSPAGVSHPSTTVHRPNPYPAPALAGCWVDWRRYYE